MAAMWQASAWIEVSQGPGTLILRVCGDLDLSSCEAIQPAILAAIPGAYRVELDLRGLDFCDSSGIAMLLVAQRMADADDTALFLSNVPQKIVRVFEVSGVDQILKIR